MNEVDDEWLRQVNDCDKQLKVAGEWLGQTDYCGRRMRHMADVIG